MAGTAKKEKKAFNLRLYAVLTVIVLTAVIVCITVFTFKSTYTAFSPEKVASGYVDGIAQSGDGYNAFKLTLVSKDQKFGSFITDAYMAPYVNEDAEQAGFVGTGSDEEVKAIDSVYETMYDYYCVLLDKYGFDDYDSLFSRYFAKLSEVRKEVYGDEYMDTEFMFGAFESNVDKYCKSLTGSDEVLAADGKTVLSEATKGIYQEKFGDDYAISAVVSHSDELTSSQVEEYVSAFRGRIEELASSGAAKAEESGFEYGSEKADAMIDAFKKLDCSDQIGAVEKITVKVSVNEDDSPLTELDVYVVKIGSSWYVDQTNIDTSVLYFNK